MFCSIQVERLQPLVRTSKTMHHGDSHAQKGTHSRELARPFAVAATTLAIVGLFGIAGNPGVAQVVYPFVGPAFARVLLYARAPLAYHIGMRFSDQGITGVIPVIRVMKVNGCWCLL